MTVAGKEIGRFLIAGFSAVATDLFLYYMLFSIWGHAASKAASFISGSIVAYLLNKYWTFEQEKKSYWEMVKFTILYALTLGANVSVNKMSLVIFPEEVFFAFLAATGTSTVLNFIGQKWWVFKKEVR